MAEKQETADDIIAEMLGARTEFPFVYLMGEPDTPEVIDPKTNKIIEPRKINIRRVTVKELADRLKAALRRERGDRAKLREAVIETQSAIAKCMDILNKIPECRYNALMDDVADELCDLREEHIKTALAAPPRNCDVGTLEEQAERFAEFCHQHKHPESECLNCPLLFQTGGYCELAWAQTPYVEKEGARSEH